MRNNLPEQPTFRGLAQASRRWTMNRMLAVSCFPLLAAADDARTAPAEPKIEAAQQRLDAAQQRLAEVHALMAEDKALVYATLRRDALQELARQRNELRSEYAIFMDGVRNAPAAHQRLIARWSFLFNEVGSSLTCEEWFKHEVERRIHGELFRNLFLGLQQSMPRTASADSWDQPRKKLPMRLVELDDEACAKLFVDWRKEVAERSAAELAQLEKQVEIPATVRKYLQLSLIVSDAEIYAEYVTAHTPAALRVAEKELQQAHRALCELRPDEYERKSNRRADDDPDIRNWLAHISETSTRHRLLLALSPMQAAALLSVIAR